MSKNRNTVSIDACDALSSSKAGKALLGEFEPHNPLHQQILSGYHDLLNQTPLPGIPETDDPLQQLFVALRETRALTFLCHHLMALDEIEAIHIALSHDPATKAAAEEAYSELLLRLQAGEAPLNKLYQLCFSQLAPYIIAKRRDYDANIYTETYGMNRIRERFQEEECHLRPFEEHVEYLENFVTGDPDTGHAKIISHNLELDQAARDFMVNIAFPRLRELTRAIETCIAHIKPAEMAHNYGVLEPESLLPGTPLPETTVKEVRGQGVAFIDNLYRPDGNFWGSRRGG